MTIETKNYFISETVKNMATIDTELRSVNSTMQTSLNEEDEIIFSPKVIQVRVLNRTTGTLKVLGFKCVYFTVNSNYFKTYYKCHQFYT
jgi:hypothetical protein